jgi:predicted nucleic acid-binding protein
MHKNIIVDTSCLIILTKIKELNLLKLLYSKVIITSEIANEFGSELPDWVTVYPIERNNIKLLFESKIDSGEASAILLALTMPNSTIIMDDLKGRIFAKQFKLNVTGAIGVIIAAKNKNIILSIKPILDKIKATNFYISKEIEDEALLLAKEI